MVMNPSFWKGRRVFVTGHTGFKGGWLCLWLKQLGAYVTGYALEPETEPSLFEVAGVAAGMHSVIGDIRDREKLSQAMLEAKPEVVIHMAAQALVRYSYQHPVETYEVNVMGTVNLLEAVRSSDSVQSVLVITSDKCYENKEREAGYREDEAMGGYDPYSNSKGCAELVVSAYRQSFFDNGKHVAIATARAGNVIGGGDWSADRLIPDMVRAFNAGNDVVIRNPSAVRPWQHVLEALHGYLLLLEKMAESPFAFSQGWNFGPDERDARDVAWIVERFVSVWGDANWRIEADAGNLHEAHLLKLDCSKARRELAWLPVLELEKAMEWIAEWYRRHRDGEDMAAFSSRQLTAYQSEVIR
ncbi:MAG: CDP-glucose 4,6-dehydratase [Zetaproteobacteria bacterium CG_4_9_14_3_um_filter_49_83]|nr:MAG: CDP-glucose 4,6-dehydratase [Zetaproteobacteria bacterium CG1_02_49_23]PIQ33881.1 MAG: CDP-glucose 4,6-dehydratase [Zetaproteobacteria bacterium CG17_big_fil_post_rev_8_21_14_2_50_50_13]PIV30677.1 MAG: CDP-glucose 4,6-dehydratase [Zetaproteobacteria bacterium CG02_land_8_20_14_3_00_50_9]PIY55790.1 MAG: CDP-glucose 4,6-dehydratase [Zetaproteobacteria bacterium CG_4_10_14_0_8_um_filter_49_80]PJA36170.1 MAG: CDP-glucose 4,6-dehydratase [Zetaproteobacteria bacterium CG_4_9_14_3_um_filter_49